MGIGQKTVNQKYCVTKLSDYFDVIQTISNQTGRDGNVLWFRGQASIDYTLLPSLYRNYDRYQMAKNDLNYSSIHLRESMRLQHYHAKNYPFIKNDNLNSLEWLGLAQHHGLKTRLLDWSFSAIHALIFAVEKQLRCTVGDAEEDLTPCIWVLEPQELNKRVIESFFKNNLFEALITEFSEDVSISEFKIMKDFIKEISAHYREPEYRDVFLESNDLRDAHLNYLFNLAFFDELLVATKNNPIAVFKTTGNPIYLLLSKYYIEGYFKGDNAVAQAPMAIIHPQHSERIRAQQGAFTIFPYPKTSDGTGLQYMAMENLDETKGILQKIVVNDPYKLAAEMKRLGINESWLYPEAPVVNNEIENY